MTSILLALYLAAVPTVTVTGKVLAPDGGAPLSGSVTCRLTTAASALDGVTMQAVAGEVTATLGVGGTISMALVPNDAMTPTGTRYTCTYQATMPNGRRVQWARQWQVASSPATQDVGSVPVPLYPLGACMPAATPRLTPPGGYIYGPTSISMASGTPASSTYYTTNGDAPTWLSNAYLSPVTISSTTTVKAVAYAPGFSSSGTSSETYSLQALAAPTYSPPAGFYSSPQSVAMGTAALGADIHFTTTGSTPTVSSPTYSAPVSVASSTVLKGVATGGGYVGPASQAVYSFDRSNNLPFTTPGCFADLSLFGNSIVDVSRLNAAYTVTYGSGTNCSTSQTRVGADGLINESARTQYVSAPSAPTTETKSLPVASFYARMEGTGSISIAASGATAIGLPCTINASTECTFSVTVTGNVTWTVTGSVSFAQIEGNGAWPTTKIFSTSRPAESYTTPPTLTSNDWCISTKSKGSMGTWETSRAYNGGLWSLGGSVGANTASLYWSSGKMNLRLTGSDNQASVYTSYDYIPPGERVVTLCSSAGVPSLWIDGARAQMPSVTLAGTRLFSPMPSTMYVGSRGGTGTELNGPVKEIMTCNTSNHVFCEFEPTGGTSEQWAWFSDSIFSDYLLWGRAARTVAGPFVTQVNAAFGGNYAGGGIIEVSDQVQVYSGGAWSLATAGTPLSQYKAVTVQYGANDVGYGNLAATRKAIDKIVDRLVSAGVPDVVVATAPPRATSDLLNWDTAGDSYENSGYRAAIAGVASKYGVHLADIHTLFPTLVPGSYTVAQLMRDVIHLQTGGAIESGNLVGQRISSSMTLTGATPEIPGRVVTYLYGQPTAGSWTVEAAPYSTQVKRLAGLSPSSITAASTGAVLTYPATRGTQIWVHLLSVATGGTVAVKVDGVTATTVDTSGSTIDQWPKSFLVADGLADTTHTVTIETTNSTKVRVVGVSHVGVP